jgi:uncharacterized alpha-E superfamily protein
MTGTSHTLSSTAQRSYWLGRYLERAESTARLVMVNGRLLYDLPKRLPLGWQGLVNITGNRAHFDELYGEPSEKNVTRFLINDRKNAGSLFRSLDNARENVRTLRGIIPRACVEAINELYLYARDSLSEPLSRSRRAEGLAEVQAFVQRIEGFMSANMLHDAHWSFLRMGNFIERADMTSRIIEVGCDDMFDEAAELEPFTDIQWRSVLLSLDATQSYNLVVQGPVNQNAVLEFLVHNTQLPRSLAYPLNSLRNSIRDLPHHDQALRGVNRLRRLLVSTDVSTFDIAEILAFLDSFQIQLAEINQAVSKSYFTFNPRKTTRKS